MYSNLSSKERCESSMSTERGKFIAFEGPEGGGKSTNVPLLAEFLREKFHLEVITTREPGGTDLAEQIRAILKSPTSEAPVPGAELLLFLASRAQHVERVIKPALMRGAWVITDRFEDSTFAYQGAGRGFSAETILPLNAFATQKISPDLVLVMDLDRKTGRQRLSCREQATATTADRIECEAEAFHERLREGFLKIARRDPERYRVIRADQEKESVQRAVREAVLSRFF